MRRRKTEELPDRYSQMEIANTLHKLVQESGVKHLLVTIPKEKVVDEFGSEVMIHGTNDKTSYKMNYFDAKAIVEQLINDFGIVL